MSVGRQCPSSEFGKPAAIPKVALKIMGRLWNSRVIVEEELVAIPTYTKIIVMR